MSKGWRRGPSRVGSRVAILAMTLLVVAVAASGCVRVHASFTVSSDDLVSGEVIIAAIGGTGPTLSVPDSMAGRASVTPYQADGYVGADLMFHNLNFAQFAALIAANTGNGHYQLALRRSGDLVSLTGSADLTQVTVTQSDVRISIDLPGPVLRADGTVDTGPTGDSMVTWSPKVGQVSTFSATAQYATGRTYPASFWAAVLTAACLLIAAFVTMLALVARRRHRRKEAAAYS